MSVRAPRPHRESDVAVARRLRRGAAGDACLVSPRSPTQGPMDRLRQDIRVALRGFRRTPSFTITAIAILVIGIGMAVAMFTVYDAVVVRNLPVPAQDRIVELFTYRDNPNTDYYLLRGD